MAKKAASFGGARVALIGGTLWDGTGRDPVEGAAILVEGNTIAKVGTKRALRVPRDCRVIDTEGATVLPGLLDLHVHLVWGSSDSPTWAGGMGQQVMDRPLPLVGLKGYARALRALESGFTTIRDVGDVGHLAVSIREAVKTGILPGPRVVACGPYLNATSGHGNPVPPWISRNDVEAPVADGCDEILKFVRAQVRMGTEWVKFCATGGVTVNAWDEQQFTDEEMRVLVSEAHRKGRRVAAHCIHSKGMLAAVRAGVDSVEHGVYLTEEICEIMVRRDIVLVPTLSPANEIATRGLELGMRPSQVEACQKVLEAHRASVRMARDMGVRIALGTDAGYGLAHGANARELSALADAGLSNQQVLESATIVAARCLGLEDFVGTIELGKAADLLVLNGDPMRDIGIVQDRRNIITVIRDGREAGGAALMRQGQSESA